VRMRVPDADIAFDDLVRGPVRFTAAHVPDYVIVRSNGEPLYTLVNPLDDSLMKITHVLRGEDLLPSTPRQIVLYDALNQIGVGSGRTPAFGHLPTVLGEGNRRLSKRDKGSGLAEYQQKGYLPEALLNYLALLGWAIAEDRDVFTIAEMVEAFDIRRVNANPARFDPRKCEAINGAHIRMLPPDELTQQLGRSPTVADLATNLGIGEEETIEALEAAGAYHSLSLDAPAGGEDGASTLVDLIGTEDSELAEVDARVALPPLLATLPSREQRILAMRFFGNLTQSQIAEHVGISQMHVSRLLAKTLVQLRGDVGDAR